VDEEKEEAGERESEGREGSTAKGNSRGRAGLSLRLRSAAAAHSDCRSAMPTATHSRNHGREQTTTISAER
jgi:hypothetical protein